MELTLVYAQGRKPNTHSFTPQDFHSARSERSERRNAVRFEHTNAAISRTYAASVLARTSIGAVASQNATMRLTPDNVGIAAGSEVDHDRCPADGQLDHRRGSA